MSNEQLALKEERNESPCDRLVISERQERNSFSSIKENVSSGFAQAFTNSKTSSFSRLAAQTSSEEAIEEDPSEVKATSFRERAKMLMPPFIKSHPQEDAKLREWKGIPTRTKAQFKSYDDLKSAWNSLTKISIPLKENKPVMRSSLETLPAEILTNIISHLALDIPPENYAPRNSDLIFLLLTSSTIHMATLPVLYRNITIPHSCIYIKFLQQISAPSSRPLAQMVRRLDFSHFNPTHSGLSARERQETKNLTKETLLQGLDLMENLQEFLGQEHIDDDMSCAVLLKLLTGLPRLQALDCCACSSINFKNAFIAAVGSDLPEAFGITRLSLHECTILPSTIFERLLPRLKNLTHLDVCHTRITDEALMSIPKTARITHLNLSKCAMLTGDGVTEFLTTHPSIIGDRTRHHPGLIYLNLRSDAITHSLLSPSNISTILSSLPSTLRSLNLSGSSMSSDSTENTHINAILPLTKHLEELSIGRNVPLTAVNQLFSTSQISTCTLRYLDISDLGTEQGVSICALLDKQKCYLLRPWSLPLEVVEVSEKVAEMCRVRLVGLEQEGWTVMEAGRRYWLVRDMRGVAGGTLPVGGGLGEKIGAERKKRDEGDRLWKMGAKYWGMRKVPVARMEVGGMYGLYMFKR